VIWDGIRFAVGTLTAFPVRNPVRVDRSVARIAMIAAPLAVLPIAVVAAAVGAVAHLAELPALPCAVLIIGTFALGTRGLHLDGLADTADGLTAGYDRDRALEVMHRGDTGPAGAAALVLVLLLQVTTAAAVLVRPWGLMAAIVLLCLARSSLLISCLRGIPAARPGLGATVAGVVSPPAAVICGCSAAALAAGSSALSGRPWWQGVAGVLLAGAAVTALVLRCRGRFGGITGDVLGAGIECAAAALLLTAAAG
jgi:adenosylcobinamide-GDP ribazoletransferase